MSFVLKLKNVSFITEKHDPSSKNIKLNYNIDSLSAMIALLHIISEHFTM